MGKAKLVEKRERHANENRETNSHLGDGLGLHDHLTFLQA